MSNIKRQDFSKMFKEEARIGHGAYGSVYQIRSLRDGAQYAFKKVFIYRKEDRLDQIVMEIASLIALKHPLVVKLYYFYCSEASYGGFQGTEFGLVMQLGKKSLEKYIEQQQTKKQSVMDQKELEMFAYQFIELFAEMEIQKKSHTDIKPANFIVFSNDSKQLNCKLTDFGLVRNLGGPLEGLNKLKEEARGSYFYMSPLLKQKYRLEKQGLRNNITTDPIKDDVYSFGLTLFQLASLSFSEPKKQSLENLKKKYNNSQVIRILEDMLREKEQERPTFTQLRERIKHSSDKEQPILSIQHEISDKIQSQIIKYSQQPVEQPQPWKSHVIQTGLRIRSICPYKDMTFVGTANGDISILRDGKVYSTPKYHTKTVQFLQYFNDQIWSGGCDGRIFRWNCKLIEKEINMKSSNIMRSPEESAEQVMQRNTINNTDIAQEHKGHPMKKEGISFIYRDKDIMAVGYYKGQMYVEHGQLKQQYFATDGAIFQIKRRQNILYIAGADGLLKTYDMDQTNDPFKKFFNAGSPIIHIQFFSDSMSIVTMDSLVEVIDYQLDRVCQPKKLSSCSTYSCGFLEGQLFSLNKLGEVYQNDREIEKFKFRNPYNLRIYSDCVYVTDMEGDIGRLFH